MAERSIEDHLREEYFDLLPKMTRVAQSFATEIEYLLRLYRNDLAPHESLVVKSRVKDCMSAIEIQLACIARPGSGTSSCISLQTS
jgi:hypothetical protein